MNCSAQRPPPAAVYLEAMKSPKIRHFRPDNALRSKQLQPQFHHRQIVNGSLSVCLWELSPMIMFFLRRFILLINLWVTRMWTDAQRDECPTQYRWRPLRKFSNSIPSLTGGQPKTCTIFGRLLGWCTTFSGALAPDGILPGAKFTLCPSFALSYIGSVTARHSSSGRTSSAKLCSVVQGMELLNFRRGRHLYSAGRPSCLASVHNVVFSVSFLVSLR